jgi:hypothetical protein
MLLSTDGGATFQPATSLDAMLGDGNTITQQNDGRWSVEGRNTTRRIEWMTFVPSEPRVRFAVGQAGVFMTADGLLPGDPSGTTETWHRLFDSLAMPCAPSSAYFDPGFGVRERALYVTCNGRGVLRLSPIPTQGTNFTVRSVRPH